MDDLCLFVLFTSDGTISYKSHLPRFSVQDSNYLKCILTYWGWNCGVQENAMDWDYFWKNQHLVKK
jgi:hypothetical protein